MESLQHTTSIQLAAAGTALALAVLLKQYAQKLTTKYPKPPGPKALPLLGNLLDLPTTDEWLVYEQWSHVYGDVMSVEALGQNIIILNSIEAAQELLERRGSIYSDRAQTVMLHELMGWSWGIGFIPYGERWRTTRRFAHDTFHVNAASQYDGIQLRSTRKFLRMLSEDPSNLPKLVRHLFGATILDVVYGIEVASKSDAHLSVAEHALELFNMGGRPGAFLVDIIPFLKYVPSWFPGAGFQKIAKAGRQRQHEMLNVPFQFAKQARDEGSTKCSMVTQILDGIPEEKLTPEVEFLVKETTASLYVGGSDTTVSSVMCLFLAMVRHPEVLMKAQAELDAVLGVGELPDFTHRADLPYINAIILELLRWQPVLPIGFPHKSTEDDEYKGYFIPKGSVVFYNTRSLLHNPEEYPDPNVFRPERYLRLRKDGKYEPDPTVRDPRTVAFGWGRRACPGSHFAERSLFAVTANLLATFDIRPVVGADGKPKIPEANMTPGVISHPSPFECVVKPRSQVAQHLIDQPLPDRGL